MKFSVATKCGPPQSVLPQSVPFCCCSPLVCGPALPTHTPGASKAARHLIPGAVCWTRKRVPPKAAQTWWVRHAIHPYLGASCLGAAWILCSGRDLARGETSGNKQKVVCAVDGQWVTMPNSLDSHLMQKGGVVSADHLTVCQRHPTAG